MKYFQALPKIITQDNLGNNLILTNILTRVSIIPELLKNPLLYYSYDVQDGETPEIIASKYYGSVDNFWVVMFSNQIFDAQWEWPLSYNNFSLYINDKYGSAANAQSQIVQYQKIVTTSDLYSGDTTTETFIIDETEYSNTIQGVQTVDFSDGDIITITTTANPVNAYDYEVSLNESKRTIKLLNAQYLGTLQNQFKKLLMGA